MSEPAITVENLSKAYRIGLKDEIPDTLVGSMTSWLKAPVRNFRRLHRLNTFRGNGEAEDIIWALRDVSFEVRQGEVLGIIGRNGAGKSTLLKVLSRITEPTAGQATIRGRVSSLLEVGTGFHPELTGRENVYLNGTILGMTRREIDRKFDQIAAFSGVEKFIDTPIKRYSSGMKVRLAFSVAAHLDPEILLVDEVLAVGDQEFQNKCIGKMGQVANSGRTVLFVSHNMLAVRLLCARAMCLDRGQLAEEGNATDIVYRYIAQSSDDISSEQRYSAVPEKRLQVLRIALTDDSGLPLVSPYDARRPFRVEITYEIRRPVNSPPLTCALKSQENVTVMFLDSRDSHSPLPYSVGSHDVRIQIPGGLLNSGQYSISVGVREGDVQLERVGGEVSVSLVDLRAGRPLRRPGFFSIRPPWETIRRS